MRRSSPLLAALAASVVTACDRPGPGAEPIFVDGRAVVPVGDTLLAMTGSAVPGVLLYDRRTSTVDTLGADELLSPTHVQWTNGRWYVSDVREGHPWIVVFSAQGTVERRIDLDTLASAPHQFAVLPDGRPVLEAGDGRLVMLDDDSTVIFALAQTSSRTGLLVAARGGVLHAVPDRTITLYNALGKIRWRIDWPWFERAFITDIAVDSRGRPHVLAGEQGRDIFQVFGLSPVTGEAVRWSDESSTATFAVRQLGDIKPDSAVRWLGTSPDS